MLAEQYMLSLKSLLLILTSTAVSTSPSFNESNRKSGGDKSLSAASKVASEDSSDRFCADTRSKNEASPSVSLLPKAREPSRSLLRLIIQQLESESNLKRKHYNLGFPSVFRESLLWVNEHLTLDPAYSSLLLAIEMCTVFSETKPGFQGHVKYSYQNRIIKGLADCASNDNSISTEISKDVPQSQDLHSPYVSPLNSQHLHAHLLLSTISSFSLLHHFLEPFKIHLPSHTQLLKSIVVRMMRESIDISSFVHKHDLLSVLPESFLFNIGRRLLAADNVQAVSLLFPAKRIEFLKFIDERIETHLKASIMHLAEDEVPLGSPKVISTIQQEFIEQEAGPLPESPITALMFNPKHVFKLLKLWRMNTSQLPYIRLAKDIQIIRWLLFCIREKCFQILYPKELRTLNLVPLPAEERTMRSSCVGFLELIYKTYEDSERHALLFEYIYGQMLKYQETQIFAQEFSEIYSSDYPALALTKTSDLAVMPLPSDRYKPASADNTLPAYNSNVSIQYVQGQVPLEMNTTLLDPELQYISLDCEWLPDLINENPAPSVLSMAGKLKGGKRFCYVISLDMTDAEEKTKLHALITSVCNDSTILKIGYDFKQDIQKLRRLLPGLAVENVYDLRPKRGSGSLSSSVSTLLGRHLDKSETLSDWTRIPLRSSQIQYSGYDALASLEVYEHVLANGSSDN